MAKQSYTYGYQRSQLKPGETKSKTVKIDLDYIYLLIEESFFFKPQKIVLNKFNVCFNYWHSW